MVRRYLFHRTVLIHCNSPFIFILLGQVKVTPSSGASFAIMTYRRGVILAVHLVVNNQRRMLPSKTLKRQCGQKHGGSANFFNQELYPCSYELYCILFGCQKIMLTTGPLTHWSNARQLVLKCPQVIIGVIGRQILSYIPIMVM